AGHQTSPASLARLGTAFELNVGQADPAVRFVAHPPSGVLLFSESEVVIKVMSPDEAKPSAFTGGQDARLTPEALDAKAPGVPQASSQASSGDMVVQMHYLNASPSQEIVTGAPLTGR